MKFQWLFFFQMEVKMVFWHWLNLNAAVWDFVQGNGKIIKFTWFLADPDT